MQIKQNSSYISPSTTSESHKFNIPVTIRQLLGTGTFGKVYEVESHDKQTYALKRVVLKQSHQSIDSVIQKCYDEAFFMKRAACPQIVKLHSAFIENNQFYLFQELMDGGDLLSFINLRKENGESLSASRIMLWFYQISLAVSKVHRCSMVHCDIKPSNLFIDSQTGACKLGDFGLSKLLKKPSQKIYSARGTPIYQPPEICSRCGFNQSSDIWALGCVLYEMMNLKVPFGFEGCSKRQLMHDISHESVSFPSSSTSYPSFLYVLVRKLLSKEADERPSISEVCGVMQLSLERLGICSVSMNYLLRKGRIHVRDILRLGTGDIRGRIAIDQAMKDRIIELYRSNIGLKELRPPAKLSFLPIDLSSVYKSRKDQRSTLPPILNAILTLWKSLSFIPGFDIIYEFVTNNLTKSFSSHAKVSTVTVTHTSPTDSLFLSFISKSIMPTPDFVMSLFKECIVCSPLCGQSPSPQHLKKSVAGDSNMAHHDLIGKSSLPPPCSLSLSPILLPKTSSYGDYLDTIKTSCSHCQSVPKLTHQFPCGELISSSSSDKTSSPPRFSKYYSPAGEDKVDKKIFHSPSSIMAPSHLVCSAPASHIGCSYSHKPHDPVSSLRHCFSSLFSASNKEHSDSTSSSELPKDDTSVCRTLSPITSHSYPKHRCPVHSSFSQCCFSSLYDRFPFFGLIFLSVELSHALWVKRSEILSHLKGKCHKNCIARAKEMKKRHKRFVSQKKKEEEESSLTCADSSHTRHCPSVVENESSRCCPSCRKSAYVSFPPTDIAHQSHPSSEVTQDPAKLSLPSLPSLPCPRMHLCKYCRSMCFFKYVSEPPTLYQCLSSSSVLGWLRHCVSLYRCWINNSGSLKSRF
ncbi:hypothetical protein ADUPG1_013105 [Aduncisulcus paluster]|uniref:non-specific serine/threonine protein kinase n=1 Tax=Aduncisulcus paluster TaxID=2918883 RepID=A0ABQ5K512_9EUKA|nr:hypothetical protein ADUPG1_013105 [Aduncisulcus paluster]